MTATTRVLVRVVDVPDTSTHPPVLPPQPPAHVMETDPPGHLVAFVNAQDPDNDTLWYYITGKIDDNCISAIFGSVTCEEQCDFRKGRSCVECGSGAWCEIGVKSFLAKGKDEYYFFMNLEKNILQD